MFMTKFNYDISISANNETEANSKMQSLTALASKLSAKELEKMAHIIKNDPVKTAIAKKYLC